MMLYLTNFPIVNSRLALGWLANRYRVHQRLRMAYRDEPRLLFRIEEAGGTTRILAQSSTRPDWHDAFGEFNVLAAEPLVKELNLDRLQKGGYYRFRLVANPVITHDGKRKGLFKEEDQLNWIYRQLERSGAKVKECISRQIGMERSEKNPAKDNQVQTHYAVEFNGVLLVEDAELLAERVRDGVGPAKAYGFGLISLAPFRIEA
ncbi:MAG: type I-E CRISPR-associated protein Cas6/Cse3/CasE [Anaerolineaceae bacterium]|nr:type I-E CRISPR-associated protein Cas6/Cse3/CasE [Anaerolineaceae bacterium]